RTAQQGVELDGAPRGLWYDVGLWSCQPSAGAHLLAEKVEARPRKLTPRRYTALSDRQTACWLWGLGMSLRSRAAPRLVGPRGPASPGAPCGDCRETAA